MKEIQGVMLRREECVKNAHGVSRTGFRLSVLFSLIVAASSALACGSYDDPCPLTNVPVDATYWRPYGFSCSDSASNYDWYACLGLGNDGNEFWWRGGGTRYGYYSQDGYYSAAAKSYPGVDTTSTCSTPEEERLAKANDIANVMQLATKAGIRKGDHLVVKLADGNTNTWDYICGGIYCTGTVLNNSPSSSTCPVGI